MLDPSPTVPNSAHPSAGLVALQQSLPIFVGCSLALVAHRATGAPFSIPGFTVLLCGIAAAYSFDRLIDAGRGFSPRWLKLAQAIVFLCSSAVLLPTLALIPRESILLTFFFAAICMLYARLKRLPLAKTFLVTLIWTWSCIALPLQGIENITTQWWSFAVAIPFALLVASACILCDLKDLEEDHAKSILTLPVLIGAQRTCLLTASFAGAATLIAVHQGRDGLAIASLALVVASCFPNFLRRSPYGVVVVDAALALPGLLIILNVV